jgi:hypothetical protein
MDLWILPPLKAFGLYLDPNAVLDAWGDFIAEQVRRTTWVQELPACPIVIE